MASIQKKKLNFDLSSLGDDNNIEAEKQKCHSEEPISPIFPITLPKVSSFAKLFRFDRVPEYYSKSSANANGKSEIYSKNQSVDFHKSKQYPVQFPVAPTVLIDRLTSLVLLLTIALIAYKVIFTAVPQMDSKTITDFTSYGKVKLQDGLDWYHENDVGSKLWPLLCGVSISVFSVIFVYLDSRAPGVNPPLPLSSNSTVEYPSLQRQKQRKNTSAMHLGYMTAIAAGLVVGVLLYLDVYSSSIQY